MLLRARADLPTTNHSTVILNVVEESYPLLLRNLTHFTLFFAIMDMMIRAIIRLLKLQRMLSRVALMMVLRMVKRILLVGVVVTRTRLKAASIQMILLPSMATFQIVAIVGDGVGGLVVVRVSSLVIHRPVVGFDA